MTWLAGLLKKLRHKTWIPLIISQRAYEIGQKPQTHLDAGEGIFQTAQKVLNNKQFNYEIKI